MEITVTSQKVSANGRDGFIATATNGYAYTTTHRQNTAEDAERVAVRLFKDGVIDGYIYNNTHSESAGEGTQEAKRQVIRYYPDWVSSLKNIMFYLLLFLIGGAALLSLVVLAVSIGVTRP